MKNKLIIILVFISILIFAGCSGEVIGNDTEQSKSEKTTWNGPTTGPWKTWNRTNNGDQYFKYEIIYRDKELNGWVTIDIKNLGNDQYEFNIELTMYNYFSPGFLPTGETTFNDTASFILDSKKGFFEATYETLEVGYMGEAIHEMISRLDDQGSYTVNFDVNDIIWEVGASATHEGNGVTVTTLAETSVLGISGYEIELQYRDPESGFAKYIVNPDIRYPLYIYEKVIYSEYSSDFYEFTLVEYNTN